MKNFLLFVFFCAIIFLRYTSSVPKFSDGQKVRITKKVLSEPVKYDDVQGIKIYNLRTYLPLFPEIYYGDTVIVEGTVEEGKLIDSELIEVIQGEGALFILRKRLVEVYTKIIPQPHSALLAGVVLGSKSGISQAFWERLKISGTAHVVVASGMNVTLVASFLTSLLILFVPRRWAVVWSIAGIWGYSFLSGMDAPIVRAAIMSTVAFGAVGLGRAYLAWRGLFASIFVMLFINPLWLMDLGFILSVSATTSLMLFESKVSRLIQFVPGIFREGLSTSLAAQVLVAPVLYASFGQLNILSPLINALVLWTIPVITILGAIGGIAGLASLSLGKLIIYTIYPLTSWFIWIVEVFS